MNPAAAMTDPRVRRLLEMRGVDTTAFDVPKAAPAPAPARLPEPGPEAKAPEPSAPARRPGRPPAAGSVPGWTPAPGVSACLSRDGSEVTLRYREVHACTVAVDTADPGEVRRGLDRYQAELVRAASGPGLRVAGRCGPGRFGQ